MIEYAKRYGGRGGDYRGGDGVYYTLYVVYREQDVGGCALMITVILIS